MGFCYAINPISGYQVLVCDLCGKFRGHGANWVRKIPCPYGYCQAWATCDNCFKEKKHLSSASTYFDNGARINHEGCKKGALEYDLREKKKKELIENGKFLRVAALSHGENRIKVIFKGKAGEKAYFMSNETYDSIHTHQIAIIEDFQKLGELTECENTYIYDNK